jgi:hypothetical protein
LLAGATYMRISARAARSYIFFIVYFSCKRCRSRWDLNPRHFCLYRYFVQNNINFRFKYIIYYPIIYIMLNTNTHIIRNLNHPKKKTGRSLNLPVLPCWLFY